MASHALILGGARSGKSRCAEQRAAAWLVTPGQRATLLATALAGDDEMQTRIARHQADRLARVPRLALCEVPLALPEALAAADPAHLLVVDCLTLWLTNLLMPLHGAPRVDAEAQVSALVDALAAARGPVLLVSNEIGLGVVPMSPEARHFVDALGRLHQRVAAQCERVTLMLAGIELPVKGPR
jgi:adenosylcobinamide kinase / adenosylcobinamide-phosphate guanylyltransferase